ncbi:MAG: 5-formyltetrahydrofolate cyclo-ligase [Erysipelotrichaceae bacterium]
MDKQTLRQQFAQARDLIPSLVRSEASVKITENMLWLASEVQRIGTYLSFGSEVDTIEAISVWLLEGKEVYVPRMTGDDFEWVQIKDFKSLAANSFGIQEPVDGEVVDIASLDLVFVPMFGFDDQLHRIGHGKGCFDRALKNYAGKKIGLCFVAGYVETIYPTESDVSLDIILTEQEIYSKHR